MLQPATLRKMEANLFWLSVVSAFSMAHLCVGVLMPFYLSRSIGPDALFLGEAAFGVVLAATLPLAGWLGDRFRRVWMLRLGMLLFGGAMIPMAMADSVLDVVLAQGLMGIGCAGMQATKPGLLFDTLKALHRLPEHVRWSGSMGRIGWYVGAGCFLAGGFAFHLHPALPVWADAALGLLGTLACLRVKEPPVLSDHERPHLRQLPKLLRSDVLAQPALLGIVLYGALVLAVSKTAFWLRQPYMSELAMDPAWFGAVSAIGMLLAGFASGNVHKVEHLMGRGKVLLLLVLGQAATYGLALALHDLAGVALLILIGLVPGLGGPLLQDALQHRIPTARRATFTALNQMLMHGTSSITLALTALTAPFGSQAGFGLVVAVLLLLALPVALWMLRLGGAARPEAA